MNPTDQGQTAPAPAKKKLDIAWFSFTCCEDNLGLLAELFNDNLDTWKTLVDIKYCRQLKTKNTMEGIDVAFIEGAISSPREEEELKEIRAKATHLVAVGSCACVGLPSAAKNEIKEEDKDYRMMFYETRFNYGPVRPVKDVVRVDASVRGCPMDAATFIKAVESYLKLYELI